MKIINEREPKYTTFFNMLLGTVFLDKDGDIMMKIRETNEEPEAISLVSGMMFDLYDEYEGIVVDATLTIK